jgi:DNA-binding CsgD family transcriptional regulator
LGIVTLIGLELHISNFGDIRNMPYWTVTEEQRLREMVEEGKSIDQIAEVFHRSPEAIALKSKRLGIPLGFTKKVTETTTTTPLEPVQPAEGLIDFEAAMRLLLGAIRRLSEPGLSLAELKQLRLLISSIKTYATFSLSYMSAYGEELSEKAPMRQPKKTESIADRVTRIKNLLKEG